MTKSIEQAAVILAEKEYPMQIVHGADINTSLRWGFRNGFEQGAKFTQDQLIEVVNELKIKLKTCENDYWFMTNLLERYAADQGQAIDDCVKRMKFRKPLFNVTKSDQMLKDLGVESGK